jgi:DNA-binding MarR family transcriptional regulator
MSARSQALTAISNAAHPNVNELAEITSLSVQSVRRTLQRLITDGKVDRIGKRGDRNTRYRRR